MWSDDSQNRQTVNTCVVMRPMELGTKNHCDDEGQQQFTSQSVRRFLALRERRRLPWRFNVNLDPASPGEGGHYQHLVQLVFTIEAKLLPTAYEGLMVHSEFEIFMVVTMKSTDLWYVASCSSEGPRSLGGVACRLLQQVS
jgi:hypothetical protein